MRTITPNQNMSYYIANALVYLASERRVKGNQKTIERALAYLQKLYSHPAEPKRQVWDKASVINVGYEFKNFSYLVNVDHTSADVEKAIICLMALRDLILNKCEVTQVLDVLRSRQVMHELKHGLPLSIPDEKE